MSKNVFSLSLSTTKFKSAEVRLSESNITRQRLICKDLSSTVVAAAVKLFKSSVWTVSLQSYAANKACFNIRNLP